MDDRPDRDPQNYVLNCFHVYSGQTMDPKHSSIPTTGCSIVDAYIVNGLDRPLFMACSADGAVYVWEKCGCFCFSVAPYAHFVCLIFCQSEAVDHFCRHAVYGAQSLVAAWQTVDFNKQFRLQPQEPAAYHYNSGLQHLCSVHGSEPTITVWDMHQEKEVLQMVVVCHMASILCHGTRLGHLYTVLHIQDLREDTTVQPSGKHFLVGADMPGENISQPLLLCSSGSGIVRLFDLRDSNRHASVEMRCHDQPLAGMALRNSGIMATAAITPPVSELHFSEIRMSSAASDSTYVPSKNKQFIIACL